MRKFICDKCGKIIDNPLSARVITCARPLKKPFNQTRTEYRGNDKALNDIIWEVAVCPDCLTSLEAFLKVYPEPKDVATDDEIDEMLDEILPDDDDGVSTGGSSTGDGTTGGGSVDNGSTGDTDSSTDSSTASGGD